MIDGQGGAAALTTTLNGGFGSAVVVPGTGLVLDDGMDDFASEPGRPNMFGLVQGEANAIAPGKRMLSSMTPTIVLGNDGKPMLVTGAQGGPTIITTTYQIMSNVIDFDMNIGTAVSAPRMHHQHLPDTLHYERGRPYDGHARRAPSHGLCDGTGVADRRSRLRRIDSAAQRSRARRVRPACARLGGGASAARGPRDSGANK